MTRSKLVSWAPVTLALACSSKLVADRADPDTLRPNGAAGAGSAGSAGNGGNAGPGPSVPAVDVQAACSAPDGHVVAYSTVKELEHKIEGDWLECIADGIYPSEYGEGVRILPDHRWYALVQNADCGYDPLDTGFDGYGTWDAIAISPTDAQFGLRSVMGGGAPFHPGFTDADQLLLGDGPRATHYVRMPPPATDAKCAPGAGGAGGGSAGTSNGGTSSGASGAGSAGGANANAPSACDVPNGHVVPYSTAAEFEAKIQGDWLQCSPDASYPSEFGDGIRIQPDHTWYSLIRNAACGYDPLTTGFDGYGTWTINVNSPDSIQFNLLRTIGGGAGYFPAFTDTGQLNLDAGGLPTLYVRMPATPDGGASCGETGPRP